MIISKGVRERKREAGTISYPSASFKDDISHGKPLTEKLKAENSLLLKQVLENLIRSPAAMLGIPFLPKGQLLWLTSFVWIITLHLGSANTMKMAR